MRHKKVTLPAKPFRMRDFAHRNPNINDVDEIIREETLVFANDELIAVYKKIDFDLSQVRAACLGLEFEPYMRQSGLMTKTININASPRNRLRDNKCQFSKLCRQMPDQHRIFLKCARQIAVHYRKYFKTAYAEQVKQAYSGSTKIHKEYMILGTPFSGGVINKDSALQYHRDQANTPNGMSCMVILKKGVAGGELILPELNIGFACQDGYMLLFDGQRFIHGVTPIIPVPGTEGYRYTIVYYNNKGMDICLPPDDEELHYRIQLETKTQHAYQQSKDHER